jgi:ABC-type branched-subunit amino acid transport system substrate-binding protein
MNKTFKIILGIIVIVIIGLTVSGIFTTKHDNLAVGAVLSLSGPAQYFGEETKKGMDLANEDKAVNLIYEDSRSDATAAISAYNKLKAQDNIKAVILSLSNVANAVVPLAEKDQMFSVQNLVSARKVQGDMSVRFFTSAEQEAPIKMTNWVMASPSVQAKVGVNGEGVYMTTPDYYIAGNKKVADFTEAYQKKYGTLPSAYSAIGYDMTGLFREATKGAKTSKDIQNNFKNIKNFDGLMGKLSVNDKGEITIPLIPAKMEGGKMIVIN